MVAAFAPEGPRVHEVVFRGVVWADGFLASFGFAFSVLWGYGRAFARGFDEQGRGIDLLLVALFLLLSLLHFWLLEGKRGDRLEFLLAGLVSVVNEGFDGVPVVLGDVHVGF